MADVKDRLEQIDERIMAGLKDFQRATVGFQDGQTASGRRR